jgi:putative intracellular protease/amidase
MTKRNVGIFIFKDVEVLDFAGPFEVFSRTRLVAGAESRRSDESAPFCVFTVARTAESVTTTGGMRVVPTCSWDTAPPIEILVVPGGFGTRSLLKDEPTVAWIKAAAARAAIVTSVGTGALLLAQSGLLRDRRATTHWAALHLLNSIDPTIQVQRTARVVSDTVVTSAGVSAGIDMSLDVVARLCGPGVARETAHYIEYRPQYQSASDTPAQIRDNSSVLDDSPVVCTLGTDALKARQAGLLARVAQLAIATTTIEAGYRLQFTANGETLPLISEMIDAERQCCRFLRFALTVEHDGGPISLEITGPQGTRELLATLLAS